MTTKEDILRYFLEGRHNWYSLKTPADLAQTSFDSAIEAYKTIFGQEPVGLIYGDADISVVPILSKLEPNLAFLFIEDFNDAGWLLYGPKGVIFSEGA